MTKGVKIGGGLMAIIIAVGIPLQGYKTYKRIESERIQLQEKATIQEHTIKELKQQLEELTKDKAKLIQEKKLELEAKEKLKTEVIKYKGVYNSLISLLGYIPTAEEIDLLERLVECEAGSEPYSGKIAVVNVVVNRIHSNKFPNTIQDVISQKYQFEPVYNGMIVGRPVCSDSKKAVKEALLNGKKSVGTNIVNFWADYLPANNPLWKHIKVECKIGTQLFGSDWVN